MKNKYIALKNFAIVIVLISSFIACDKDFVSLDSDIINNDNATHFITESMKFDVVTYTKKLDLVQTNNLPIYQLGVFNDAVYGTTTASVVTQIANEALEREFGENLVMDSVVLTIPYFSRSVSLTEEGETLYELDSVFGETPIKLSIFENNYFIRDFDPSSISNDRQKYYSDGSSGIDQISQAQLEGELLFESNDFVPSNKEIVLKDTAGVITERIPPAMRLKLNEEFWVQKIIEKEGEPELSNLNNFKNYFRGIYFKAEANNSEGNLSLINFNNSSANIIMYYTIDDPTVGVGLRVGRSYQFTFTGNRVNFISEPTSIKPDGDNINGDENLFIKAGQGSLAVIDLFTGVIQDPDSGLDVSQLDYFKSKNGKWLINEANLVFYVNQNLIQGQKEPDRIYLYNLENKTPLADYYIDPSLNSADPTNSRTIHLGKLIRVGDDPNGLGIKYKIRVTEHLKNILLKDSTNVKLGLSISTNVDIESSSQQYNILTNDDLVNKTPLSSIITPYGTVLYGNNTTNNEKKVYLEIYYTEPKNN